LSGPTSAASSAAIENIRFEVVSYLRYDLDLAPADFWSLQLSRNITNEISHVMKCNLVQEIGFENILMVIGLINLLSAVSVELNEREMI
jgi:hypothetical protein